MAFFGLKLGLNLEMRAAHPHQKFQGVPPRYKTHEKPPVHQFSVIHCKFVQIMTIGVRTNHRDSGFLPGFNPAI